MGQRVVLCAFGDPATNPSDFYLAKGLRGLDRHLRVTIGRRDLRNEITRVGIARHDGGFTRLTAFEQAFKLRHHKVATAFRALMATQAIRTKDRQNLFVETDGRLWLCDRGFRRGWRHIVSVCRVNDAEAKQRTQPVASGGCK